MNADALEQIRKTLVMLDPLNMVVRAHLEIEVLISEALVSYLPHPEYLNLERFSFAQKAQIAGSLGILDKGLSQSIFLLNSCRNKLVHRKNHTVTDDFFQELRKYMYLEDEEKQEFEHPNLEYSFLLSYLHGQMSMRRDIFVKLKESVPEEAYALLGSILGGDKPPKADKSSSKD